MKLLRTVDVTHLVLADVEHVVGTDFGVTVTADAPRLRGIDLGVQVVQRMRVQVAFGTDVYALRTGRVVEGELVVAVAAGCALRADGGFRAVGREVVRRTVGAVVAADADRPIRIAVEERDEHLHADARD